MFIHLKRENIIFQSDCLIKVYIEDGKNVCVLLQEKGKSFTLYYDTTEDAVSFVNYLGRLLEGK